MHENDLSRIVILSGACKAREVEGSAVFSLQERH